MGGIHFEFLSRKKLNDTKLIRVNRNNTAYSFFHDEYLGLNQDADGNLIVSVRKERLLKIKRYLISRRVEKGSRFYNYIKNEYRQNSLMEDSYGNILLSDEVCHSMDDQVSIKR